MKKILSFILILSNIIFFTACSAQNKESFSSKDEKIKVVVSFNPLKEYVKAIGKDKVEIKSIIPEGSEPHDFEPKIRDMESINSANIFVYNGFGMEAWVDKTLKNIDNKGLVVVEASKNVTPLKNKESEEENHEENKEKHEHNNGQYDPHTWLSIKAAVKQSEVIKDALIKVDPKNKNYYENNYKDFREKLEKLYDEYKNKFESVKDNHFVTGHAAFGYLCRDFNLEQNSVENVFAEGEPTTKKMKELIDYCKKNNIKTVFLEENVSEEVSKTLAKEVGAKVEKIYTLTNSVENKGYIEIMQYNLEKIYESLK
ncbi:TPA: zinc ABC transporter substrate-binding protein [Clostridium botulinum]|uniref:metal ABC transporter solute-binding protein, Zn/Mn family n=1 Tax=Clostridium TaxID=1485 RepID=UPI000773812C|nr:MULTISPECIES: zinc ABC transporter substrate-binding protein [Clostridium]AUM95266.1 ABC transporter substrate-binding protein [Clostridium sporogenes]AVQ52708.1 ABC transporter substrate-binding protein [Clostridium botulinum]HBJ2613544.1 zinc ABC transporter substrate-binding protein [Clostridium botulinum]